MLESSREELYRQSIEAAVVGNTRNGQYKDFCQKGRLQWMRSETVFIDLFLMS